MKLERICYWILIFVLGILLFYNWKCTGRKPCPTITQQVIHDTIRSKDSITTAKPQPVSKEKTKFKFTIKDGVTYYDSLTLDTTGWVYVNEQTLNDLTDKKKYSQFYNFGTDSFIVNNEVQYNELQNQKVIHTSRHIDSTVYITQTDTIYKEKSKGILYLGGGFYGNKFAAGAIGRVSFKFKTDHIISAGRMQGFANDSYWFGGVDIPIKLKKQKR